MKLPWSEDPRRNGSQPPAAAQDDRSIAGLAPGDAISFWGEGNRLVSSVFECAEGLGERPVKSGGLLEQFEARVRNDSVGDNPVFVELRGRRYRATSTGTAEVKRRGEAPRLAPWDQFVADPNENVYFSLVAADDEAQGVLGIWTSHVCLSFGRPIAETDVDGVYRRRRSK
jgi:hypothetical protein